MKLAIDCRFIGNSGIGTVIANVVDEFVNNHQENEYVLFVKSTIKEYSAYKNVKQIVTEIKPFTLKELFLFPVKEINMCDAYYTPYINVPMGIKVPVFCTIHDLLYWDIPNIVSTIGLAARTFFVKHAIFASEVIFTDSKFSEKSIIRNFHPKKEIKITTLGVAKYLREFNENVEKKNFVMYVGNIKPHKGLQVLVDAFKKASSKGFDAKLVIVGNKEKFRTVDDSLEKSIEGFDNIEFTGFLSNEQLVGLMASARILVQPSFYEGFGLPPLEAMYLGTDPIVSNIEVLDELYHDYPVTFFKCGDSDDLADKLISHKRLIESEADLRKRIDNQYSFAVGAQQILDAINAKIKNNK